MRIEIDGPDDACDPHVLKNVILAMAPQVRVKIITPLEKFLPSLEPMKKEDVALMRRARAIAQAIIEAPEGSSWKKGTSTYLISLLVGGDTWEMSTGDAEKSPRPEAIAFSRYMKKKGPFSDSDKPAEHLANHKRVYFEENGGYKGIEYVPTKLGKAVYAELKAMGWPENIGVEQPE